MALSKILSLYAPTAVHPKVVCTIGCDTESGKAIVSGSIYGDIYAAKAPEIRREVLKFIVRGICVMQKQVN